MSRTALVTYDQVRQGLAKCVKLDEAMRIRDWAARMRFYARQANDYEAETWMSVIKARAWRKIGELSKALEKAVPAGGRGNVVLPPSGRTKAEALEEVGLSVQSANRAEQFFSIPEEEFERFVAERLENQQPVAAKELLSRVPREWKKRTEIEELNSLASIETKRVQGVFDVVVIDPPWPMSKIELDHRPEQTALLSYPVMTVEQIQAIEIPAAPTCHIWLWTTQRFLQAALSIGAGWGFDHCCMFVWHKPGGFQPLGLPQYNCEFAVYFRVGAPKFVTTKDFKTCFHAPRGAHSEKPEEFYEMVRRVTAGRRLDMFNRRPIDGFEGWGNQAAFSKGSRQEVSA